MYFCATVFSHQRTSDCVSILLKGVKGELKRAKKKKHKKRPSQKLTFELLKVGEWFWS